MFAKMFAKKLATDRKRDMFQPACGYATREVRQEFCVAQGIAVKGNNPSAEELTANPDTTKPLYFWQLYSLLGRDHIHNLIKRFYKLVFDDNEDPAFRDAFTRIAGLDHHIATQVAYWVDALGGGRQYHGSSFRLKFHHENNARDVMNAQGAQRWMYHMTRALKEFEPVFKAIDPRIPACIVGFLELKMKKYARQFGWKFQGRDFAAAKAQDPHVSLAANATTGRTVYSRRELAAMSVKTVKAVCRTLHLDVSRCVERAELIATIAGSPHVAVVDQPVYDAEQLKKMSARALKQMAKCLQLNTSRCLDKYDIIAALAKSGQITVRESNPTAGSSEDPATP